MTQQHPITPPPDLMEHWLGDFWPQDALVAAAQWGADAELEACCEWLSVPCPSYGRELRNARRPKTPSLKEQALLVLDDANLDAAHHNILLRALEQLDD
jgi:hypothetical protein